jgi:hypothetical protein
LINKHFEIPLLDEEHTMLDYRLHYAQMAAEDRLREARDHAVATRGTKRVFQLSGRRSDRKETAR